MLSDESQRLTLPRFLEWESNLQSVVFTGTRLCPTATTGFDCPYNKHIFMYIK